MTSTNAKLDAPSFHRNIEPITTVLRDVLPREPADVLEIGSGTGQHVASLANVLPHLTFWPTEYDAASFASIDAWSADSEGANIRPARKVDVTERVWFAGEAADMPEQFAAILCFNVIHISPWEVTEGLFSGAARLLAPLGQLILYGPYRVEGEQTADSNIEFEKWLKARDPRNGVRDIGEVEAVANQNSLMLLDFHEVPANNFMPVFGRS